MSNNQVFRLRKTPDKKNYLFKKNCNTFENVVVNFSIQSDIRIGCLDLAYRCIRTYVLLDAEVVRRHLRPELSSINQTFQFICISWRREVGGEVGNQYSNEVIECLDEIY